MGGRSGLGVSRARQRPLNATAHARPGGGARRWLLARGEPARFREWGCHGGPRVDPDLARSPLCSRRLPRPFGEGFGVWVCGGVTRWEEPELVAMTGDSVVFLLCV